eukprot:COSAG04_NODE_473_length_13807_cov_13.893499_15_plen_40_part_00
MAGQVGVGRGLGVGQGAGRTPIIALAAVMEWPPELSLRV